MKQSLFMVALCGAAVCLPACKEALEKKTGAERAPKLVKQSAKKTPVHPEILALGQDMKRGTEGYDAVRQRLFALPRELSKDDSTALLDLLLAPPASNWTELGWAAIVNDGFNILREGKNQPEAFMEKLVALHRDSTRSAVLRDYALQHFGTQLALYYRDPQGNGKVLFQNAKARKQAEDALKTALSPGSGTTMGTACNVVDDILTACKISGTPAPLEVTELCHSCKETVLAPKENIHARITALGMLGRHRSPLVLKEARLWMMDDKLPILFRAAAIAYIGNFPAESDRAALNTLTMEYDLRLAQPAKRSLSRLNRSH